MIEMDILNPQVKNIFTKLNRENLVAHSLRSFKTRFDEENVYGIHLANLNLNELPEEIFSGLNKLEELVLSHNQIKTLPANLFADCENLKVLWLHSNHIQEIHEDSFRNLKRLDALFLNNNNLKQLSPTLFDGLENIRDLRISNNFLSGIHSQTFSSLKRLTQLSIHSNQIETINAEIFLNNPILQKLYLNNNKLDEFDMEITNKLPLHLLNLSENNLPYDLNRIHRFEKKIVFEKFKVE